MNNFVYIVSTIFGGAWELFQTTVPGFNFSYADLVIATSFAVIGLGMVRYFLNLGGFTSLGRSTRNPKISKERENDTK